MTEVTLTCRLAEWMAGARAAREVLGKPPATDREKLVSLLWFLNEARACATAWGEFDSVVIQMCGNAVANHLRTHA